MSYTADYAKSGRAQCRWCRSKIEKGVLRLAAMVQSSHHDGKDPYWYHYKCFFTKYRYLKVDEIDHYHSLEPEHQALIKNYLDGGARLSAIENPQKSGINGLVNSGEFYVGYAKSNASHCVSCNGRIAKEEVRISQMDYTSERALQIPTGKMDRWHHVECFAINREKLEFFKSPNMLPGFRDLKRPDQVDLFTRLSKSNSTVPTIDKLDNGTLKSDNATSPTPSASGSATPIQWDQYKFKEQEELLVSLKDNLTKHIQDKELLSKLLVNNNQDVPVGVEWILQRVMDVMAFGALQRCDACKGQLEYKNGVGYQCTGYINIRMKCGKLFKNPARLPFEIPEDMKDNLAFQNYSFVFRSRITPKLTNTDETAEPPKKLPKIDKLPLQNLKFLISDGISSEALRIHLKNQIERNGGKIMAKSSTAIAAVVSTPDEVKKMTKRMTYAKTFNIPVISADFANSITDVNFCFPDLIKKFLISTWMPYGGNKAVLQASNLNVLNNMKGQTKFNSK